MTAEIKKLLKITARPTHIDVRQLVDQLASLRDKRCNVLADGIMLLKGTKLRGKRRKDHAIRVASLLWPRISVNFDSAMKQWTGGAEKRRPQ